MTRRLYLQLYLAFLAVTMASLLLAGLAFRWLNEPGGPPGRYLRAAAHLAMRGLPPPRSDRFQPALRRMADELSVDLLVLGPGGRVVGDASKTPWPAADELRPGWFHSRGEVGFVVRLDNDARVAIRERERRPRGPGLIFVLAVVALGMAVGCFPIARTITRRLESLDEGVRRWGAGQLNARVSVAGRDEVARVAESFNQSAARVESLVTQQREMLANASHELRSPLTRLRMALELISESPDPGERQRLVDRAAQDIVELDALVEDVLLVSRADAQVPRRPFEPVNVGLLVEEEAARVGARGPAFRPPDVFVPGDASMLRHLLRNLLENAFAHGEGRDVSVSLVPGSDRVLLVVEDRGPGVPPEERDKIFAPFYRPRRTEARGRPGTGLGLALVRQVARYHQGEVTYRTRTGGGSRFEVVLPAAKAT